MICVVRIMSGSRSRTLPESHRRLEHRMQSKSLLAVHTIHARSYVVTCILLISLAGSPYTH